MVKAEEIKPVAVMGTAMTIRRRLKTDERNQRGARRNIRLVEAQLVLMVLVLIRTATLVRIGVFSGGRS